MNDNTKLIAGIIAAGSIGSFGGHTVGSTTVDSSTLESCREFILHAREHERLMCEDDKLKQLLECVK